MDITELLVELQAAVADLYWISESDYPFEVIDWSAGEISTAAIRLELGLDEEIPITTLTLAEFWEPVTDNDEFIEVRHFIARSLTNTQVFRVGEIEIDIYIIGHCVTGKRVGLKTKEIET
jgi:Nuclease A inhibitor-like protein